MRKSAALSQSSTTIPGMSDRVSIGLVVGGLGTMTELPFQGTCCCSEIMLRRRLDADAEGARLPENRKGETGDTESYVKNEVAWDRVQSFVKELPAASYRSEKLPTVDLVTVSLAGGRLERRRFPVTAVRSVQCLEPGPRRR